MTDLKRRIEQRRKAQRERVKRWQQSRPSRSRRGEGPTIQVGTNVLSDQEIHVPVKEFCCHTHIMGATQMGKSKWMENIFRHVIKAGHGMIVMDGKGDLYDSLLKYCIAEGLKRKLVAIDPNDDQYSVGINYLELFGGATPSAWSSTVLKGLMKMFDEDDQFKAWLQEWGPAALTPLIHSGMTLTELSDFVSVVNPQFRETVLESLGKEYQQTRKRWDELKAYRDYEATTILQVLRTRGNILLNSPVITSMLGQQKTTIDWKKVMDQGGIVLVNLHSVGKVDPDSLKLLGIAIFHQIIWHAYIRPKTKRKPFFVMVDEFQQFASSDFEDAMVRLMGYGVYLMLSHQNTDQIRERHPALWSAILANCWNKIYFNISDKDAKELSRELFAGQFKTDEIKDEIKQTKYEPKETTRIVEGESRMQATSEMTGQASGSTSGSAGTTVTGSGETIGPGGLIFAGDMIYTSTTESGIASDSRSSSLSQSRAAGISDATSQTRMKVPFYEYEKYMEVSSRTFWTGNELAERFIAWMTTQSPRRAQLKIGLDKKPIPIYTPEIRDRELGSGVRERFLKKNYEQIALPTSEVLDQINQRVQKFIEEHKPEEKQEDIRRLPPKLREKNYARKKPKKRKIKKVRKRTN